MKKLRSVEYYSRTAVKKRGWNDKLIEQFLGEPDDIVINMYYKSGPPVCLYDVDRVHAVESTKEFQEVQKSRKKRRDGARKAVATKEERMRQLLDGIELEVPEMPWEVLTRRAVDHFNDRALERDADFHFASADSDEAFLDRIRVNYLRHELTAYEQHLQSTAGKVGAADAYLEIKRKVLNAISDIYPELNSECSRQSQRAFVESLPH